jgi:hypothetical protein
MQTTQSQEHAMSHEAAAKLEDGELLIMYNKSEAVNKVLRIELILKNTLIDEGTQRDIRLRDALAMKTKEHNQMGNEVFKANAAITSISASMAELNAKIEGVFSNMREKYNILLTKYNKKVEEYVELQVDHNSLKETYNKLKDDYDELDDKNALLEIDNAAAQRRELAKSDELNASYRRELQLAGELHQLKRRRTDD